MHSHYEERVSPPPSDFLMGDAVVASALDQYSKFKKSVENLPDDELLKAEEKRGTAIQGSLANAKLIVILYYMT